jgi:hypothetical protein
MQLYQQLRATLPDPDHVVVGKGSIFSVRYLAEELVIDLMRRSNGLYASDEIWLDTLEAFTGNDMTTQVKTAQHALNRVQQLLAEPRLHTYEPGVRYFFGHRTPFAID